MIPVTNDNLKVNFQVKEIPTRTYKLNTDSGTISGFTDGQDAMRQAIFLILNDERYEHIIFSWNRGVEFKNLYGQPMTFVLPEIKRRITESLMQDSRITGVDDFSFVSSRGKVQVTFTVHTIFGDIQTTEGVNV